MSTKDDTINNKEVKGIDNPGATQGKQLNYDFNNETDKGMCVSQIINYIYALNAHL